MVIIMFVVTDVDRMRVIIETTVETDFITGDLYGFGGNQVAPRPFCISIRVRTGTVKEGVVFHTTPKGGKSKETTTHTTSTTKRWGVVTVANGELSQRKSFEGLADGQDLGGRCGNLGDFINDRRRVEDTVGIFPTAQSYRKDSSIGAQWSMVIGFGFVVWSAQTF